MPPAEILGESLGKFELEYRRKMRYNLNMIKRMDDREKQLAKDWRKQGWTYQKIADALGFSVSTIHVAINPTSAERKREAHKRYYREHKAEHKRYYEKYRATHKEQIRKNQKEHLAEREARDAIRRARIKAENEELTPAEKEQVKEIYRRAHEDKNVRCYICGRKIPIGERHVDHIIPISQGGSSKPSNLAISCRECNLKKHAKMPQEIGILL